ncbi:SRPBCC family protein [Terrarubrum flagellatum]|uniref:SRPBCC family protein n=1 Tax=Terrirubrum flagellatum TaxID=2895980 RepID=UPI003144FD86
MTGLSHIATCHVQAPADVAFAYLSDPIKLGRWSLGCFDTGPSGEPGVYTGLSLFDGGRGWYRIDANAATRSIDFHVGAPPNLTHRISARVMAGAPLGYSKDACLVTLMAWRPANMDDDRWNRLCASHDAEIWLIKAQIETEYQAVSTNPSR